MLGRRLVKRTGLIVTGRLGARLNKRFTPEIGAELIYVHEDMPLTKHLSLQVIYRSVIVGIGFWPALSTPRPGYLLTWRAR